MVVWRYTQTHTHTRLMALFPGLPGWAGTRKVKLVWILLKQETMSGSVISWATCKSAPRSRQITTPAPHHSVFYKHWRHIKLKLDWHKSKAKLTATFTASATFRELVVACMNIHMLHQYLLSWKTFLTLATDVNVYWAVCLLAAIQPTSACKRFVTCAA